MRRQASLSTWLRPAMLLRTHQADFAPVEGTAARPARTPWWPAIPAARRARLARRIAVGAALALLLVSALLLSVRAAHVDRVFPAIVVGDVPVGGLTLPDASNAVAARAAAVEASEVAFSYAGKEWRAPLRDLGVSVDVDGSLTSAYAVGREPDALARLRSTAALVRADDRIPLAVRLDYRQLGQWFDKIDAELGTPPKDAALKIDGATVAIVPDQDGTAVDRGRATDEIEAALGGLRGLTAPLPTAAKAPNVRAADLGPARDQLVAAMANPVQVTFGGGLWTLPSAELGAFVRPEIDPSRQGADAVKLSMDRGALATWLEQRLAPDIDREPKDAQVGWNGEKVVSVVDSVDGVHLEAEQLADRVQASFFGQHGAVEAPATITPPQIDSKNLDKLGITTLLGSGSSNYSGSTDGRATNVGVGANLLNGTLVPPRGVFSFNNAIGVINEEKGFVEAQVISGESIGKDIGGGICQVSTTVFRAAFLAGFPITEWWPHRFRIPFYEMDGWAPGLDASILQPTEDPSTWADFKFENPSDHWLLVESWADGAHVVVNIYGADLGYTVKDTGPTMGAKFQVLPDQEVVDPKLDAGTINMTQNAATGQEVSQYRQVFDRGGTLLWERNFYTKYFPRGNVWTVSPDMKGKSPADPKRPLPPLPEDKPDPAAADAGSAGAQTQTDDSQAPPADAQAPAPDGSETDGGEGGTPQ